MPATASECAICVTAGVGHREVCQMKLTELILILHTEMLQRGNVDVWLGGPKARAPEVHWSDAPVSRWDVDHPAGIYIN
jgi:hypothetical protein